MEFFERLEEKGKIIVILVVLNLLSIGSAIYFYQEGRGHEDLELTQREIVVYIIGEVVHPNIYVLPEGTYLYEVIQMAGGLTEDADLTYINLAEELLDGQKITIPKKVQPGEAEENPLSPNGKININTASKEELMRLKGIGEVKAERIIQFRVTYGPFRRIEDIMRVPGIGVKTFEGIKDDITI